MSTCLFRGVLASLLLGAFTFPLFIFTIQSCIVWAVRNAPATTFMPLQNYSPLDPYGKSGLDYESRSVDAKIVVMGNTGVGKTSLLQRYTQNKFDPRSTTSTTGAFFVTKKVHVNGLKVRLQLWDTAGQERFRSMAPMYYRGANAALLLYDITNSSTFEDVRGWLEELKKNCSPDLIIYIVGSKADLHRNRQVTSDWVRLSLARWFPPPGPPRPAAPPPPQSSTLSYIRPRFTSFTATRSIPPNQLAPKAMDDNALSRPSELRRSTTSTAYPRETPNFSFGTGNPEEQGRGNLRRAKSSNAAGDSPRRQKLLDRDHEGLIQPPAASRFGSHFGLQIGGGYSDTKDSGSSNSLPEEDEDTAEDEWGLEKGMSLFEVSAKDDTGVNALFDSLIDAIIQRKDFIEQENELKKRDSVMLTSVPMPAWAAQADEEEKARTRKGGSWSCCQI